MMGVLLAVPPRSSRCHSSPDKRQSSSDLRRGSGGDLIVYFRVNLGHFPPFPFTATMPTAFMNLHVLPGEICSLFHAKKSQTPGCVHRAERGDARDASVTIPRQRNESDFSRRNGSSCVCCPMFLNVFFCFLSSVVAPCLFACLFEL